MFSSAKETTDIEQVEVSIQSDEDSLPKPSKPLTGKQKKRLRKEKAAARKREKFFSKPDEEHEVTLNLEQLTI